MAGGPSRAKLPRRAWKASAAWATLACASRRPPSRVQVQVGQVWCQEAEAKGAIACKRSERQALNNQNRFKLAAEAA